MPSSPYIDEQELVETYDYLLKIILIGESGVGKTCLLHHYLSSEFNSNSPHTIGVAFSSTILRLPSTLPPPSARRKPSASLSRPPTKTLKLQCWDTAGQERFRAVTRNYYRSAIGALICYDITRRSTFDSLSAWLADARALGSPDLVAILVGNMLDKEEEREVSWEEGELFSKQNNLMFVECSSLTGENISQPFYLVARTILTALENGSIDPDRTGGVSYGDRSMKRSSQHFQTESSKCGGSCF